MKVLEKALTAIACAALGGLLALVPTPANTQQAAVAIDNDDIGGVVAFLCSDEGKWLNGQRLEVSGGIYL